jgi:acyl carrier protein
MVPTHFVILEQLPLSPNGKVNYQALPQVERSRGGRGESFGAPRNALEETLCAIFAEILGREEVGIGDNFFRIGGHSLLAAQAAARIRETFGVSLELRSFFASPTVAGLSEQVTRLGPIRQTTPQPTNDEREEFEL